jgi:hypothetical protein
MLCREWGELRVERQWGGMHGASGGKTNKKKAKSKTDKDPTFRARRKMGHPNSF